MWWSIFAWKCGGEFLNENVVEKCNRLPGQLWLPSFGVKSIKMEQLEEEQQEEKEEKEEQQQEEEELF